MPQSGRNRSIIVRAVGASLFAVVLWGIVSMSEQFDTTLDVPLSLDAPENQALMQPIPSSLRVRVRATGWNLLKMLATGRVECVLRPGGGRDTGAVVIGYGRRDLLASFRTDIPTAQQLSVVPDTLTVVLGPVATKVVPLSPEVTLAMRRGFQVIGGVQTNPDSIALVGSARVLEGISRWPTAPLALEDVHHPIVRSVAVSDSMRGMITPLGRRAEIVADVQEIAERVVSDVPVLNRGTIRDTSLRLVMHPPTVEVLLRGGARDLSRIDPTALRVYVQVLGDADTLGVAYPRLVLPQGYDVNVVSIKPARVRFLFRRTL